MKYVVFMLILPWLAYALYQDWKDAHEARRQQSKPRFLDNLLQPKGFSNSGSGRFLLILGLAAIGP
jgi:hypothetical protein